MESAKSVRWYHFWIKQRVFVFTCILSRNASDTLSQVVQDHQRSCTGFNACALPAAPFGHHPVQPGNGPAEDCVPLIQPLASAPSFRLYVSYFMPLSQDKHDAKHEPAGHLMPSSDSCHLSSHLPDCWRTNSNMSCRVYTDPNTKLEVQERRAALFLRPCSSFLLLASRVMIVSSFCDPSPDFPLSQQLLYRHVITTRTTASSRILCIRVCSRDRDCAFFV